MVRSDRCGWFGDGMRYFPTEPKPHKLAVCKHYDMLRITGLKILYYGTMLHLDSNAYQKHKLSVTIFSISTRRLQMNNLLTPSSWRFNPYTDQNKFKWEIQGGGFFIPATWCTLVELTLAAGLLTPKWSVLAKVSERVGDVGSDSFPQSQGTFMQRVTSRLVVWSIGRKCLVRDFVPESCSRRVFNWSDL